MRVPTLVGIPVAAMLLFAPVLCATAVPECQPGTLADYEALTNGCTLGPNPTFTVGQFSFDILQASAGAYPSGPASEIAASIKVMPVLSPDQELSLSFSSPIFSVGSGQSVQYLIAYTEDPPPPEIIRFGLELTTDPPVYPGVAQINTDVCVGAAFNGSSCNAKQFSLSVFDNGIASDSKLSDQTPDFSPPAILVGVQNVISLDGGATGSASFSSFEDGSSITGVPEPATLLLFALGLTLLLMARYMRTKSR
jgi:hypothetical protein